VVSASLKMLLPFWICCAYVIEVMSLIVKRPAIQMARRHCPRSVVSAMRLTVGLAALFSYTTTTAGYIAGTNDHWFMGSQGINLWRLRQAKSAATQDHKAADATRAFDDFISATFEQPLDHFAKGNSPVFNQRYWFSTRHFNASRGGPVIVLDSGESPGEGRLRYLDTGIVDHLAEATGGLGVVLEHRSPHYLSSA
jgi:hypothetical protein